MYSSSNIFVYLYLRIFNMLVQLVHEYTSTFVYWYISILTYQYIRTLAY